MTDTDELRTDGGEVSREEASFVEYGIEDKPPLLEAIPLGIQHYLAMIGATVAIPLVLSQPNLLDLPLEARAQLIGTFFVVSGIATLLQTTIGNRYPIVQGGTFALLAPAIAIILAVGGPWEVALRELQGAIIVAALAEVVLGYSGALGKLKYYLSPVVIAPVIVLIGLSLVGTADVVRASQNWWLLGLTLFLIVLFSQYLSHYNRFARLFPVLLGVVTAWLVALALTVTGTYEPTSISGVDIGSITEASMIQVITPFQWGTPVVSPGFVIGMFAGVMASMIESLGDYYAVARISGVGAPSEKRINHGIGMEGIGNVIAGIMGTGNGSTSYGENIGAIAITGVASRYVVQIGAIVMLIAGFVGYFSTAVATIPKPIVGGLYIAMFGQIAAVGLANLRYVDLNSSRNLFIIGLALFVGLAVPEYMANVGDVGAFQEGMAATPLLGVILGNEVVANTIYVVGSTTMAVGGIAAFVLDNTVKGTKEERGLAQWEQLAEDEDEFVSVFDRMRSPGEPTTTDKAD